ncbi:MAG TPA: hypothetical protein VGW34_00075 [Allosphingosinicella sp.]|nr:hypothetical protein [Allosphingosinicella sp.]
METIDRIGRDEIALERLGGLMASIGWLFFHWSALETTLVDEVRRLRIAGGDTGNTLVRIRGTLSERLAEWRALISLRSRGDRQLAQAVADLSTQIERLQRLRNLIAQNFAGASDEDQPVLFCADKNLSPPTAEAKRFTLSEMEALIDDVRACRDRLLEFGQS